MKLEVVKSCGATLEMSCPIAGLGSWTGVIRYADPCNWALCLCMLANYVSRKVYF